MANGKKRKSLVPGAEQALEKFKMEIAAELGIMDKTGGGFESALERYKHEIASELGISSLIEQDGWKSVSSRQCGIVGGKMGGKIGGQMVKKMIAMAESNLKS